jgi:hypothetical protein
MRNFMIDVAFIVEGPWEDIEEIPTLQLLLGMHERLVSLTKAFVNKTEDVTEAFGFCDSSDV